MAIFNQIKLKLKKKKKKTEIKSSSQKTEFVKKFDDYKFQTQISQ